VAGAVGAPAQFEVAAALQHAIEDRFGEIGIVEHAAPGRQGLVRREEHGALVQVAIVHHLEEHIGRVGPVAEIADLVDYEHVGMRIRREDVPELPPTGGVREVGDERGGRGEDGVEAILDGAVGDGDREVRLAGPARPADDERMSAGDELETEGAAEEREADRGLEGEVVLVDGLEKREVRATDAALDPRLGAMRDFLGHEDGEVVAIGHVLALGPRGEVGIEAAHGGQVEPPQEGVEVDRRGRGHALTSTGAVASRVRTYSAPMAPCCTPQAHAARSAAGP
jgi:hypothetical protein